MIWRKNIWKLEIIGKREIMNKFLKLQLSILFYYIITIVLYSIITIVLYYIITIVLYSIILFHFMLTFYL